MAKVKATKAARLLAGTYDLDLKEVPVDKGGKVTVEDVKNHLEALDLGPEQDPDGTEGPHDLPGSGPAADASAAPMPSSFGADFQDGEQVMVRKKFLGIVVGPGPIIASDGKKLWRVNSPSHPWYVQTVAYAPEDLTRALA